MFSSAFTVTARSRMFSECFHSDCKRPETFRVTRGSRGFQSDTWHYQSDTCRCATRHRGNTLPRGLTNKLPTVSVHRTPNPTSFPLPT